MSLSALAVIACGSSEKKVEPPEYFYAQQGKPFKAVAPKGINMPDLSGALVIPSVNQPLGEYDPKLIEPPNVIGELGEQLETVLEEDEEEDE